MNLDQKGREPVLRRSSPAYPALPESGILVFESHHSTTFSMDFKRFPFYKLCWIPVGRGALEFGSSRLPLGKDELLLIPAEDEHRFVDNHSAPLTLVFAFFSQKVVNENKALQLLMPEFKSRFQSPYPIVQMHSYRRGAVRDIFKRMLLEQTHGGAEAEAILHAGLIDLLVHLLRSEPLGKAASISREQALDGTLDYIEHFFHTTIAVNDLAEMCGISSRRYSDLFKQRTGKTVVQYLSERRITYAQERLKQTGQIMYAALAAGFSDITHFYRVFKRMTNMTPGEYLESVSKSREE
ncbi:helix-turn-helix domain-containing protein [Bythopirellula polymerisocia]|uniref:HTH-type transcriptional activator Btr n=1 Tax=Bythopirellula polymerisocia TaxID=2528003 RepID=A0A5C6CYZ3_9BACT|nr:AraC family transcriptional regulator [Bythopirellula polymerisocia]TWU27869.1 HTH-type transcriptional activator Btr [Bythopirellula polymerisocia]